MRRSGDDRSTPAQRVARCGLPRIRAAVWLRHAVPADVDGGQLVQASRRDFHQRNVAHPASVYARQLRSGWAGFGGIPFVQFFRNSLLYSVVGTILVVCASAVTAYGFARMRFFGRRFWFTMMLMTLMLPIQVQVIPEYILFSKLGFLNTFWPLLLPRIGGQAFFIFMIMQFIRGIPRELDDATAIDGCGELGIFWRIIVPLISPALVTAAIFSFYFTWGDFLHPLIYLNDPRLYTISVALRTYADPAGVSNWGAIFAMATLALVPVFAVFIFFQRYLVEGISTAGLSGR